jgi:hypothetical protein
MRNTIGVVAVLCGSLVFAAQARAAVWNEVTQGDISGNRQSPSSLNLTAGPNLINATTSGGDQEYLRLNVPAGGRIDSLFLRSFSGFDGVAFIGIQQGSTFTEDPGTAEPIDMLGYAHFGSGAGNVGADLLPQMASGFGAQGFTPPLTGGVYTIWIQQLGSPSTYQLDVVATPEPAGAALLVGACGLACLRRRGIHGSSI